MSMIGITGPNVAGVLGTAIAAGLFLIMLG